MRTRRRDREIKCPHQRNLQLHGDGVRKEIRQRRCDDDVRVLARLPAIPQPLAHQRRVNLVECADPPKQAATAIVQFAQLAILADRELAWITGHRREIQTAPAHQSLEPGMRDDPYVMAGGFQSGTQRHARTHVTLGADGDHPNAHRGDGSRGRASGSRRHFDALRGLSALGTDRDQPNVHVDVPPGSRSPSACRIHPSSRPAAGARTTRAAARAWP